MNALAILSAGRELDLLASTELRDAGRLQDPPGFPSSTLPSSTLPSAKLPRSGEIRSPASIASSSMRMPVFSFRTGEMFEAHDGSSFKRVLLRASISSGSKRVRVSLRTCADREDERGSTIPRPTFESF